MVIRVLKEKNAIAEPGVSKNLVDIRMNNGFLGHRLSKRIFL